MCGSGMRAAMFAHDMLLAGSVEVIVAGGMERMTNAPYLLPKARGGMRMGHGQVLDHMFLDCLEDAYDKGRLMGTFADECAAEFGFTREAQDGYAIESLARAKRANENGAFAWEMAAVAVPGKKGDAVVSRDEQPFTANPDKILTLRPAFGPNGTVTTANASSISDGAVALVMMRASTAERLGATPIARVAGHSTFAQAPSRFTTAPVGALQRLFERTGWRAGDIDLFEINEAFAVVAMAAMREHGLPHERVNVNGGACALGHPIGASGARILVTLLGALRARRQARRREPLHRRRRSHRDGRRTDLNPNPTYRAGRLPRQQGDPQMKTVLIVGASRGLGREFVRQYRRDGWNVLATARDAASLDALRAIGATAHALDVTDASQLAGFGWKLDGERLDTAVVVSGVYGPRTQGV
ncbi:MAG: putative acetyl-CoA acyltransferase [Burkholderia gladioli]|nr:MAG: putative acetyl-CoA acyltransferase [Burkholderia gladioli]